MIERLETRAGRVVLWVLSVGVVVILALAVGRTLPTQPMLGITAALVVLALGVTAAEPAAVPLITMPVLVVVARISVGGIGLSVSDAALLGATLAAVVFAPRPFSPPLRTLLWLSVLYQVATLFTVFANPFTENVVEWFHAWMLVAGALLAGWAVGRSGYARLGLSLLVGAILALALVTIVQGAMQYAAGNFGPVYPSWPYGMHKNFAGTVLGFGAAIVYANPGWIDWARRWSLAAFWTMSAGLLLTQSRQAIIGLGVALVVIALRSGRGAAGSGTAPAMASNGERRRRRSRLILLAVVPALVLVGTLVKDQVEEGNQFNSVFQRIRWFEETLEFWAESPWVGHGLRFWTAGRGLNFQPPNAELEMLASAGVLGLVGFVLLMGGALVVLWRVDPAYGTLAAALLLSRLVQSQLDLFWVAVQTSIPFVVAGVCLGAEALARDDRAVLEAELAVLPPDEGEDLVSRLHPAERLR